MSAGADRGYTTEEFMAAAMAREVRDGEQAAVGTISPVPAAAVILAYLTHAPRLRPIIINSDDWWPFRGGSKEFYEFAQKGRLDLFFLSGGQIDRHGNLNTIAVGDPEHPRLRLPGGAGSAMLYYMTRRVVVFRLDHSPRIFVERVDVVNAPGSTPPSVVRPGGPWKLITPLCIFRFDPETKSLRVESVHPGVTPDEVRRRTGFPVEVSSGTPVTPPPTPEQLRILRERVRPEVAKIFPLFARTAFRAA
ncbi:MAG TPA: CoA-transferase [Methylomirabilota bacterium]|nr:CoA-transferase [Methylomirabilota bacterium]